MSMLSALTVSVTRPSFGPSALTSCLPPCCKRRVRSHDDFSRPAPLVEGHRRSLRTLDCRELHPVYALLSEGLARGLARAEGGSGHTRCLHKLRLLLRARGAPAVRC